MPAVWNNASDYQAQMEAIQHLLAKAIRAVRKREGRLMQPEDTARLQEALHAVAVICDVYREALFEQVHSVRVKQILSDFDELDALVRPRGQLAPTSETSAKARIRIKSWQHESRRWVADLPLQHVLRLLPERDGQTREERAAKLKECWQEAGGAFFTPPPRRAEAMASAVPDQFQVAVVKLPPDWAADPLDAVHLVSGQPKWECHPEPLLCLLDFAREALLLEASGADRGGRTTFAQRRRRASPRNSLAFSCILLYEQTIGPKSARQSQSVKQGATQTPFEVFVEMVHILAIGGKCPQRWSLGPDPIRKAIATQRAWQRLFKAAGVSDADAFDQLPMQAQQAARAKLKPKIAEHLMPAATP